jgi:hypothetical protein
VAIKGGQLIHAGNGTVVVDRVQTGGPGQVNIPTEKINELGNYKSVATIRDTPDLTFSLESFDTTTEIEQMLTGVTSVPGGGVDLATSVPIDIASQFKAGLGAVDPFKVVSSVAVPFLYLEQMSYRFGLRDNATQSASLRGDTIFYNPGAVFVQEVAGSGTAGQTVVSAHPAYASSEADGRRVLSVTAGRQRLTRGVDYTETVGTVTAGAGIATVTIVAAVLASDKVRIIYSSPDPVQYLQATHPATTVKPAAIKGRDIDVYVGGFSPADIPGSAVNKLGSVQAATVDWRVTIDKDEEFGNYYAVGLDFDVPTVNGSIDVKPRDSADFMRILRKVTGVASATAAIGTTSSTPLAVDVVIKNPADGSTLKRIHVPDARFTPPGYQGRVQQKLTLTLPFESDEGSMLVFDD